MKKMYLLVGLLWLSLAFQAHAQRYLTETFSSTKVTENVVYGQATNVLNIPVTLSLDIYEPEGDTETNRPLMLLMHGGSFVAGDKKDETIVNLCENFARKGYVTASMSYRLGIDITNLANIDVELAKAVIRSFQDHNAALRFFYKSVQDEGNPYGIDVNRIISGGVSAGAISAVHSQLFSDINTAPADTKQLLIDLGGPDGGNDGSPGYPKKAIGLFNIMGAIQNPAMVNQNDVATISFHGTEDVVVPYGTGFATFNGLPVLEVSGSSIIHQNLAATQAREELNTYENIGHDLIFDVDKMIDVVDRATQFFYDNVVNDPTVEVQTVTATDLRVYPNPVQSSTTLQVETRQQTPYILTDLMGRTMSSGTLQTGINTLDIHQLKPGLFMFITNDNREAVQVY